MKFRTFRTYTRNRVCTILSLGAETPLRLGHIILRNKQGVFIPTTKRRWTHVELDQLARVARSHADFYNEQDERRKQAAAVA